MKSTKQKRVTMNNLRNPILGITAGVLLLAGCSAGGAATDAPTAAASAAAVPSAAPQQGMGFGGAQGGGGPHLL